MTDAAAAPPLASGRLHPASIGIGLLKGLRRSPAILIATVPGFASGELVLQLVSAAMLVVFPALLTIPPVLRYFRFSYHLDREALTIREGILRLRERRIPVRRIQDVSSEESVLFRMFGVVSVKVESSGSGEAEATLDGVSRAQAEALRSAIDTLADRGPPAGAASDVAGSGTATPAVGTSASGTDIAEVGVGELLLLGLTDNRAGVVLVGSLAFVDEIIDAGGEDVLESAFRPLFDGLVGITGAAWIAGTLLAFAGVTVALLSGWLASAVMNVVRFWGFRIRQQEDVYRREYGLFTRRSHAMPTRRIQLLRVADNGLRRLFGIAVLEVRTLGAAVREKEAQQTGSNVLLPAGRAKTIAAVVESALPGITPQAIEYERVSPRFVGRYLAFGTILAVAGVAFGWPEIGAASLLALLFVPLFATLGFLAYRVEGFARVGDVVALRSGVWARTRTLIPAGAIQSVDYVQGPWARFRRVANLRIRVGGGAFSMVRYVPAERAATFAAEVAEAARRTPLRA